MTSPLTPPMAQWTLPFFDEVHRDVAARLPQWIMRQQVDETDDRKACQEWAMTLDQAIEAEAQAQAICMQTQDFQRAYEAFSARQKPVFQGD